MNDDHVELLEAHLDGALSPDEAARLRRRLQEEPALAAELDQLRAARAVRAAAFSSLEGDDDIADRLIARANSHATRSANPRRWLAPVRFIAAAAACVGIGFVAGSWLSTRERPGLTTLAPADSAYRVAITDDSGRIIAVQRFESMQQAAEFSEDLQRWQERQEQIQKGQVTIRSASF